MSSNISRWITSALLALLVIQPFFLILATDTNQTQDEVSSSDYATLDIRAMTQYNEYNPTTSTTFLPTGANAGKLLTTIGRALFNADWWSATPKDKLCGSSSGPVTVVAGDGNETKVWYAVYSEGSDCETSMGAKDLAGAINDVLDGKQLTAVCVDFNQLYKKWHGVVGLATSESNINPETVCSDHVKSITTSKRDLTNSLSNRSAPGELVKRDGIKINDAYPETDSTKFSDPDKSQGVIFAIADDIMDMSQTKNCSRYYGGTTRDFKNVSNFYYVKGEEGKCETKMSAQAVVHALANHWTTMDKFSGDCLNVTSEDFQAEVGISAMPDRLDPRYFCVGYQDVMYWYHHDVPVVG